MMNKRGSILITVLIMISICTTVALFIHERAANSYGAVVDLQTEYQGAIYAMTAAKAIEAVFEYDSPSSDGVEDMWNMIPPIPVDKGFLTIYIKPLGSRFPMNALAMDNETKRERYTEGFEKLLTKINAEPIDMQQLLDWLGSGNPSSDRMDLNNTPYSMKGSRLNTLAELYYLPDFEYILGDLKEYISIGEDDYKINLNLAPEEVILAVLPELEPYINDILSKREDQDFKNVSDIYQLMGGGQAQDVYNEILPFFDVKSTLFYIKIELNVLNEDRYYHILFKRNGKSAKPVKYIEGGNIEYF